RPVAASYRLSSVVSRSNNNVARRRRWGLGPTARWRGLRRGLPDPWANATTPNASAGTVRSPDSAAGPAATPNETVIVRLRSTDRYLPRTGRATPPPRRRRPARNRSTTGRRLGRTAVRTHTAPSPLPNV